MTTSSRPDILIYGMNYAPELTGVGRYTGELAQGLAARGLKVEVVTAPPHYPGWYVREPYNAWTYKSETDAQAGIKISRCPLLLYKAGSGIWRLVAPVSFAAMSAPVALWRILRARPRSVLCVEPTLFVAPIGLLAARLVGARTAIHIQDLEVDAAFAVGHLKPTGGLSRLAFAFEQAMLKPFHHIVTISEQMARRLRQKGVTDERLSIIRNWVDTSKIYPLGRQSAYRAELGFSDEDFVVLYSGQIGPKQALQVVFEAAKALADEPGIKFVVAGEGPMKATFVERYGALPNVRLLGLQPEERLNEFLNLADCHILPQDPAVKDLVLPSKLGGMLASGKQILVMADDDSELADFLGTTCVRVLPADAALLPQTLHTLAQRPADTERDARLAKCEALSVDAAMDAFAKALLGETPVSASFRGVEPA